MHNHREASSQSDPGLAHPWYLLRLSPLCLNDYFVADKHEKNQKLVLSFQALSGKFRDQTSAICGATRAAKAMACRRGACVLNPTRVAAISS